MVDADLLRELDIELRRLVDRLDSMPLARAESVTAPCHDLALRLVDRTRLVSDEIPVDASLPGVGPSGLGSQLAIVGRDLLRALSRPADAGAPMCAAAAQVDTLAADTLPTDTLPTDTLPTDTLAADTLADLVAFRRSLP